MKVPLSDEEQRLLEQMERALAAPTTPSSPRPARLPAEVAQPSQSDCSVSSDSSSESRC
jgi:hypothetical protein